jgi:hypothetical protein
VECPFSGNDLVISSSSGIGKDGWALFVLAGGVALQLESEGRLAMNIYKLIGQALAKGASTQIRHVSSTMSYNLSQSTRLQRRAIPKFESQEDFDAWYEKPFRGRTRILNTLYYSCVFVVPCIIFVLLERRMDDQEVQKVIEGRDPYARARLEWRVRKKEEREVADMVAGGLIRPRQPRPPSASTDDSGGEDGTV